MSGRGNGPDPLVTGVLAAETGDVADYDMAAASDIGHPRRHRAVWTDPEVRRTDEPTVDRPGTRRIGRLAPVLLVVGLVAVGLSVVTSRQAEAIATGPLLPFSRVDLPSGLRAAPLLRWQRTLDSCASARVLQAEQQAGRIFVAVACGATGPAALLAFDGRTGRELWRLSSGFGGSSEIAFTVAAGAVVVGTDAQFSGFGLVSVDAATGRERWRSDRTGRPRVLPGDTGTLVVWSPDGIAVLDAATGGDRWVLGDAQNLLFTADGIVSANRDVVRLQRISDGAVRWEHHLDTAVSGEPDEFVALGVLADRVLITTGSDLVVVDPDGSSSRVSAPIGPLAAVQGLGRDIVLLETPSGSQAAVRPDGSVLWQRPVAPEWPSGRVVVERGGGTRLYQGIAGRLVRIDPLTGAALAGPADVPASRVVPASSVLYATTGTDIVALDPDSLATDWSQPADGRLVSAGRWLVTAASGRVSVLG